MSLYSFFVYRLIKQVLPEPEFPIIISLNIASFMIVVGGLGIWVVDIFLLGVLKGIILLIWVLWVGG